MTRGEKWKKEVCTVCGLGTEKGPFIVKNGKYYHSKCLDELIEKERDNRRNAIKVMGLSTAFATAAFLGVDKLTSAATMPTGKESYVFLLPQLYFDPPNPQPGQILYRMNKGVFVYRNGVENRNIYSNRYIYETTVSSKGIFNGLSDIPNDGADFGPDTMLGATSPNQYGPPCTQTSGIQEALNYAQSELQMYFPP